MNHHDYGDLVRVTGTFTTAAGSAVDPSTVTFYARTPAGIVLDYVYGTDAEVIKSATGIYYVDVSANEVGRWRYSFRSTGTGQAAATGAFQVDNSVFL